MEPRVLTKEIEMIDVQGWDFSHTTSVLIIRGRETSVIETGHHRCGEQILLALKSRAIPLNQVRYVCVTHRHGDHCGGATPLATKIPNAVVCGHKYTIATLHNPSKLNEGARQLFGVFAQDIQPLPPEIPTHQLQNGDQINLGQDIELEVVGTPGHTSDHLAYFEQHTQILYTGDAMGLLGPVQHTVTPTSFPPSFKFNSYKMSIEKLRTYDAKFLVFSHFGAVTEPDISTIFDRALMTLDSWRETVEQAWHREAKHKAVVKAIRDRFLDELEVFPPKARPLFIEVMARGLTHNLIQDSQSEMLKT
ncbi:MAG: MBL fold metallo-hydrolase [Candidatus Thorarchaeota archaeon]